MLLTGREEVRAVVWIPCALLVAKARRRGAKARALLRVAPGADVVAMMECHGDEAQLDRESGRAFVGHRRVCSFIAGAAIGGIAVWIKADLMSEIEVEVHEVVLGRLASLAMRSRGTEHCLHFHVVHNFGMVQAQLRHRATLADVALARGAFPPTGGHGYDCRGLKSA